MKLTLKLVRELLSMNAISIRHHDGEYRVNFSGRAGTEATAYYTNDLKDALDSGRDMARRRGKAQLGVVVGALMQAEEDLYADPMNDYAGFTPDPTPQLLEIMAQHGWTLRELQKALLERTSARWVFFNAPNIINQEA